MPFWARARRALRQAIPCIGPSRLPSPIPTPNPADTQPNESQGQEPSGQHVSLQQQQPEAEHGSAQPIGGSQDMAGGSPNVAPQQSPSPDPTSSLPQAQPSTLKPNGVPQAGASRNDILNNISEEDPSPDPASSLPQQQQPTSEDNSLLPIGAPLDDSLDRTPQDNPYTGPTPSAAQKQQQHSERGGAPQIEASEHDSILERTPQEAPSAPDPTPTPPQQLPATLEHSAAPTERISLGALNTTPEEVPLLSPPTPYADREEPIATTTAPPEGQRPSNSKFKPNNIWYTTFKTTVNLVAQVSDMFPPLKTAATGINALMEVYETFLENQEEFEKLADRVKLLQAILRDRPETLPAGIQNRQDGLARAAKDLGAQLDEKTKEGKVRQVLSASDNKQEVLRLIREITFAIEFAMLDVALTNEGLTLRAVEGIDWLKNRGEEYSQKIQKNLSVIARDVAILKQSDQLKKLGNVKNYDLDPDAPECVAGSRVALIAHLLAWAEDPSSVHAFWLSGMAGTGKTAVSRTLCHQLKKRGLLGASFFCSVKVQELRDVRNIIPSLAKTLAERYPEFGNALVDILEEGKERRLVREMKLREQYDFLIVQPAQVAFRDLDKNIVLCTDALDECQSSDALKEFLESILSEKPGGHIKFFFTSRPEVTIKQAVESSAYSLHRNFLRLHDIEKDVVRPDIQLYVNHELGKIPELLDEFGEWWPPPEVDQIVKRADGLFIVAATIIRGISGDGESGNPVRRLKSFGAASASTGVQQLYLDIMEKAVGGLLDSEKDNLRSCLSLLVAARRPLSVTEYAALLGWGVSSVTASFRSLHSVVEIPAGKTDQRPISIYHASFADFLTDYSMLDTKVDRGGMSWMRPPWAVDRQEAHCMALEWGI